MRLLFAGAIFYFIEGLLNCNMSLILAGGLFGSAKVLGCLSISGTSPSFQISLASSRSQWSSSLVKCLDVGHEIRELGPSFWFSLDVVSVMMDIRWSASWARQAAFRGLLLIILPCGSWVLNISFSNAEILISFSFFCFCSVEVCCLGNCGISSHCGIHLGNNELIVLATCLQYGSNCWTGCNSVSAKGGVEIVLESLFYIWCMGIITGVRFLCRFNGSGIIKASWISDLPALNGSFTGNIVVICIVVISFLSTCFGQSQSPALWRHEQL